MVAKVVTSVYRVPVVDYHIKAVLTNTMATGAYRGAGRPEANYLMERLMEKAARETGIDRVELRRRNLLRSDELPYKTHVGEVYDTGDFERVLDGALALADWKGFEERKKQSERRGRLRGRGVSVYLEWTGALPTETVDIEVAADGTVTVFSGTQAMGQGLETTYTQLVVEILGVVPKQVKIVQGDTDRANGVGSVGSRSAFVGGSAVAAAGRRMISQAREFAAEALEAAAADIEVHDGRFRIAGTDRAISFGELAARQPQRLIRVSATQTPSTPSWPNGAQVCEVEIDPDTGVIDVVNYVAVDDCGRVINHVLLEGQLHGGIVQGIGQVFAEEVVYDAHGQLLTGTFMDYPMPRSETLKRVELYDHSVPSPTNPLGVKGAGEAGTTGAIPTVANAVIDALRPLGIHQLDFPYSPARIWQAIDRAKGSNSGG
jgi:carbon-monoxide dehydrogenase large subunit